MGDRLWTPSRFQSTHPLRGATSSTVKSLTFGKFQSTHPLRGATVLSGRCIRSQHISIHAPLAGCDVILDEEEGYRDISIHAPLAGCDAKQYRTDKNAEEFQSTHPLRGATDCTGRVFCNTIFQSTHPLRGATRRTAAVRALVAISIHAPLAGCDLALCRELGVSVDISIHAPLAGCDISSDNTAWIFGEFQSTHPLRGATCDIASVQPCLFDFNPRTPCGVRRRTV